MKKHKGAVALVPREAEDSRAKRRFRLPYVILFGKGLKADYVNVTSDGKKRHD
jgi:hypothetical protein